ncbi:outer membrane protein OmpK [Thalassotalea sp. 1_MG-2023]|uniref:outer membrane protein OmpK n=1 Tax=Thalassotalea sp. 1_MG-2023 TaxID=3062680 RepID=UPI0026E2A60A|nr:outer membrane protein OmpK [Thalassotalea sp. 1_MG-2023]MDO6428346.1 outer membrane protein OmpK [Thalassotalea sp. 1_MG-2023]
MKQLFTFMRNLTKASVLFAMFASVQASAETLWSDYSVTLLKGNHYEVGDNDRTVFTFEHAAGYSWGDSFLFVDRLHSNNGDRETYIEISPRFQLSSYQNTLFENIYLATTAEAGDGFTNYLVGLGTNIKLANFLYFKTNVYYKNNDFGDNNIQSTISWAVPIGPLMYDGFLDYMTATDNANAQMNFTSQLKYDLAPALNLKSKFYVGIEYVHWDNKFGIKGVDERNVNLLLKYHF